MDGKNKDNLQSRREFFKTSSKSVLPVIGSILLSQLPTIGAFAATGCGNNSCYKGCDGTCSVTCGESCLILCDTGCRGGCTADCGYTCSRTSR